MICPCGYDVECAMHCGDQHKPGGKCPPYADDKVNDLQPSDVPSQDKGHSEAQNPPDPNQNIEQQGKRGRGVSNPSFRFFDSFYVAENGCWQWRHSLTTGGYGVFSIGNTRFSAHRFSYWLFKGDYPADKPQTDHLCKNRGCVNPDHLEAVTLIENVRRGDSPPVIAGRRNHCEKGHEYTPENTSVRGGRYRRCKACNRAFTRKYWRLKQGLPVDHEFFKKKVKA